MKPITALPFVFLSLSGCNKPNCSQTSISEEYALDAELPLGFTGQEAIDTLLGEKAVTVHWEDGSSEPATLSVEPHSDPALYWSWSEVSEDCPTQGDTGMITYSAGEGIYLQGVLQIVTTESAALNESFELPFGVESLEEATVDKRWLSAEFQGSYEAPTCDECEAVYLEISGSLAADSSTGTLSIYGTVPYRMPVAADMAAPEPSYITLATITWD